MNTTGILTIEGVPTRDYASLRGVGFAYAAMVPFCFQSSHDVLLCKCDAGSYSLVDEDKKEIDNPEEEEDRHTTNMQK